MAEDTRQRPKAVANGAPASNVTPIRTISVRDSMPPELADSVSGQQKKLRAYALRYAARGMSVFPLAGKDPAIKGGHGFKDATADPETINHWFDSYSHITGIGQPTGNGKFVLDVDAKKYGEESLDALTSRYGPLPTTRQAATGGGGLHLWFLAPEGLKIPNSASTLGTGLDVRGDGGYVVVPPSIHPVTRGEYFWDTKSDSPSELEPIAPAPEWLLRLILQGQQQKKARTQEAGPPQKLIEGQRNNFLFKRAAALRGQGLSETLVIAALRELNQGYCDPPLHETEVERTARSGARYAPNRIEIEPLLPVGDAPDLVNGFKAFDVGNAERLFALHGQNFHYDKTSRAWMVWDGRRWQIGDDTMPGALMTWTGIEYLKQALNLQVKDQEAKKEKDDIVKRASLLQQSKYINSALTAVKRVPQIWREVREFDCHAYLWNCANGTLDLRTGKLGPHVRDHRITHLVTFDYEPDAQCPVFMNFLFETMGGGPDASQGENDRAHEYVKYLLRSFGYALCGVTDPKGLWIFHGETDTGKTTLLATIQNLLGSYAVTLPIEALLTGNRNSAFEEQIYKLRGARMAVASEPDSGVPLSASRIKQLTQGGQKICTVTPKFMRAMEFRETWKIFIDTNPEPRFRDTGDDIWERVRIVPFRRRVPKEKQDLLLWRKLYEERVGIFAALVRGFMDFDRNGLGEPPDAVARKREIRLDVHPLTEFFADRCYLGLDPHEGDPDVPTDGWKVGVTSLKMAYHNWCTANGRKPLQLHEFKKALSDLKIFDSRDSDEGRIYKGIGLRPINPTV